MAKGPVILEDCLKPETNQGHAWQSDGRFVYHMERDQALIKSTAVANTSEERPWKRCNMHRGSFLCGLAGTNACSMGLHWPFTRSAWLQSDADCECALPGWVQQGGIDATPEGLGLSGERLRVF